MSSRQDVEKEIEDLQPEIAVLTEEVVQKRVLVDKAKEMLDLFIPSGHSSAVVEKYWGSIKTLVTVCHSPRKNYSVAN